MEIIPTKNIPSKTPAPPIATNPPYFCPSPKNLGRDKISAPIKTPRTPEIKAQGVANSGAKIKAKIAEKIGGIKAGNEIPIPGIILAKNLQIIIIKIVAIKTG